MLDYLGRATAKVHCVSDSDSDASLVDFQTEDAIVETVGDRDEEFRDWIVAFAGEYAAVVRDDHRRFVDAFRTGQIPGVREPAADGPCHAPRGKAGAEIPPPLGLVRAVERRPEGTEDRLSITARRYSPDRRQLL